MFRAAQQAPQNELRVLNAPEAFPLYRCPTQHILGCVSVPSCNDRAFAACEQQPGCLWAHPGCRGTFLLTVSIFLSLPLEH